MGQLLALSYQFGICDQQDALSEGQKDGTHLLLSQGCTVYAWDTPIQTVATRLLSVGLCVVLQCHAKAQHTSKGVIVAFCKWPSINVAELHSRSQNCCPTFHEIWPASWSSGQSLWLLIMRPRVQFPVLPWEFSLKGRIPVVTMVWVG